MKKLLLIIGIALIGACQNTHNGSVAVSESKPALSADLLEANKLPLGPAQKRLIRRRMRVFGHIEAPPQSQVNLTAPVPAYLQSVKVIRGESVQAGQILLYLKHPNIAEVQEDFFQFREVYHQMRREWERSQALFAKGALPERDYLQSRSNWATARTDLAQAIGKLENMGLDSASLKPGAPVPVLPLRAPFSGQVESIALRQGELAQADQAIIRLLANRHLHLELRVPARHRQHLRAGQKLNFWSNLTADSLEGEIYLINQVAEDNGFFIAHGHFADSLAHVFPGVTVEADVFYRSDSLWALPAAAVSERDGHYYALYREGDQLLPQEVEVFSQDQGWLGIGHFAGGRKQHYVLRGVRYLLGDAQSGHSH